MSWLFSWNSLLDIGWLLFLSILLKHFWFERRELKKATSWLIAKGHITRCNWTEVGHSIWPKIEYTYTVHEHELKGEYLFLDTDHNDPNSKYSRTMAYNVAVAFKENKEIDVYYNPNQPEQSALDITIPFKLNLIIGIISAFLVVHIAFIVSHFF